MSTQHSRQQPEDVIVVIWSEQVLVVLWCSGYGQGDIFWGGFSVVCFHSTTPAENVYADGMTGQGICGESYVSETHLI